MNLYACQFSLNRRDPRQCMYLSVRVFFLAFFSVSLGLPWLAGSAQADVFRKNENIHLQAVVSPLGDLARLESAAAWAQLAHEADRLLAESGLSGQERAEAHVYRAWAALGLNDEALAQAHALAALELAPGALLPELVLCIVGARQGYRQEAESRLKSRTQRGEPGSREHAALAVFYQYLGDWHSARHWYAEALRLEPHVARRNADMAITLWRLGDFAQALACMDQAVRLSPGNADFYNERGMMLLSLGQDRQGLKDFSLALDCDPLHCGALLNRGNAYFYTGQRLAAEADFSLGLSVYPYDPGLLTSRARVYAAEGRYAEAHRDLETAWRTAGSDVQVLNDLAWFLATCPDSRYNNGVLAVELAQAAQGASRLEEPGLYDTLAAALARAGDFEQAAGTQRLALSLGREQGLPAEVLAQWAVRLDLYLRGLPFEQAAGK